MDVLKGKWLHPTTGAVLDASITDATEVTKDSIKFTYFIHHQRFGHPIRPFFDLKRPYFDLSEKLEQLQIKFRFHQCHQYQ